MPIHVTTSTTQSLSNKTFVDHLSTTGEVYSQSGNSLQWNSAYSTVNANSATTWNYQGTDVKALTSNWQNTYSTVQSNSAQWAVDSTTDTGVRALTGDWQGTYSTVQANSATTWNYQGTDVKSLTSNWQNTYTNFSTQSANNISVYTTVNANSATWGVGGSSTDTGVRALTSNWQSTYTTVLANSASWKFDVIQVACSDETTALTVGTNKTTFRMPYAMALSAVRSSVTTAPSGSALVVDINKTGLSILSTKLSIDSGARTSTTATTQPVISGSSLSDDAEITIDIDQIGSTIAGAGLKVTLIGTRT